MDSDTLIEASWSVVVLKGAVSRMTSVLMRVSRLSPVSVQSGVVSVVCWITKLLRVLSPEPEGLGIVVVFIFGLLGPISGLVIYYIWKMRVDMARL